MVISCEEGVVGAAGQNGEPARIGSKYLGLASDVRPQERILLDDGMIELEVLSVDGTEIETANLEIIEQRFFGRSEWPETATTATRRRLAEMFEGAPLSRHW